MQRTVTVADPLVKSWKGAIYAEEKQSPPDGFRESKGSGRDAGLSVHEVMARGGKMS